MVRIIDDPEVKILAKIAREQGRQYAQFVKDCANDNQDSEYIRGLMIGWRDATKHLLNSTTFHLRWQIYQVTKRKYVPMPPVRRYLADKAVSDVVR